MQGILTYTHTLTVKRMYDAKLRKRGILGWTLFVSLNEVSSNNLTITKELSKIGGRINALRELRCGIH